MATKPNIDPVDRYTLGHGAFGFMLGLWGMPWYAALGTSIAFEIVENAILKPWLGKRVFPVGKIDSPVNMAFDVGAWMAGWGAGKAVPFKSRDEIPRIWR